MSTVPVAVGHALVKVVASGEFWPDLRITLFEVAVAFAISAASGVLVGYLVSRTSFRTRVFEPLGETLTILGESGSGKSVSLKALMGLLPAYAKISGKVWLNGQEILGLPAA